MRSPAVKILLGGAEAELKIDLNVLGDFEELTGVDVTRAAPSDLTLSNIATLVRLCLRESLPGLTDEDVGRSLLPAHVPEILHAIVCLMGASVSLPPVWWPDREAVYQALLPRLSMLVDVSPGSAWMANRYAADGRKAVVLDPPAEAVLHDGVIRVASLREALAHASEAGGWWASVMSVRLELRDLEDSLIRGLSAWTADIPALSGFSVETIPLENGRRCLVRTFR